MASIEELRAERLKKRELLEEKGFDTYPAKTARTHTIFQFKTQFETLASSKEQVTIAGRIMSQRGQGALAFSDLFDGTGLSAQAGKTQLFLKSDEMDGEIYKLWGETTDVGDFVEATGIAYLTQRGEQALFVSNWKMLTKSLLPLPEKWHGITDPDERYRKRYLDILTDPELQDLFYKKSQFWEVTRNFMKEAGFLEVETPTIEVTTGGAEANPFKTRHNDFDIDVFMRISVGELWQKRLMAAGFAKTFEIGRVYRNEGSSPDHLQEFTNMEFYWAYADYEMGMDIVEQLYKKIAVDVFGKTEFTTRGHTFDLNDTWKKIDYVEEIEKQTGINVLDASDEDMKAKLDELGVKYEGANRERLTDTLWKYCRKGIAGPAFLVRVPKLVSPLAKSCTDDPRVTERFQVLIAGSEVGNGFSELNDPIDQRSRFELQQKMIEAGDSEAMMPEWEFVEMLEHGMPPTCGFGFGERLFAFLVDKPLRETQMFPLLKPKLENEQKKKELSIATIVLNKEIGLLPWQELNTIAHLNAAFGARVGKELFTKDSIVSKDNIRIKLNTKQAILIKEVSKDSQSAIKNLIVEAGKNKLEIDEFTREMLETTNANKITEISASKPYSEIEHLGVLIYGPKSVVDDLTKDFKLYS